MFRKTILTLTVLVVTLTAACGQDGGPTRDEVVAIAEERGFTVIEDTWIVNGIGHGVSVEIGRCKGTYYISDDSSVTIKVYGDYADLIATVGDMRLDALLGTYPTDEACAPS